MRKTKATSGSLYSDYLFDNANFVDSSKEVREQFRKRVAWAGLLVFFFILIFAIVASGFYRKIFWKTYFFPPVEDFKVQYLFTVEKGQYVRYSPLPNYLTLDDWFYRFIFEPLLGSIQTMLRISHFNPYILDSIIVFVTEDYRDPDDVGKVLDTAIATTLRGIYFAKNPVEGDGKLTRKQVNDSIYIYEYHYEPGKYSDPLEYGSTLDEIVKKHQEIFERNRIGVYILYPEDYFYLEKGRRYFYFVPRADVYIESFTVRWNVIVREPKSNGTPLGWLKARLKEMFDLTEKIWLNREIGPLTWATTWLDNVKYHRFFITDKIKVSNRIVKKI